MESNNKRNWNTPTREPWNRRIYYIIKAIDHHNDLYFYSLDSWHLEQSEYLRNYLNSLKTWIKNQEAINDSHHDS